MISYAQAREDILLHRALHHVPHDHGFYIDVGGYHPTIDSVTKHFYDHGWRGVNIEPGHKLFPEFEKERERDVNLQVAISDRPGDVTFHEVAGQLGTLEDSVARTHAAAGIPTSSYTVPAMTLTQVCERHAPADIHFLKIDVEGHEAAALRGMDFTRFRPWVLVVEATQPNRLDLPTHGEWEDIVVAAGYSFMLSDLPNRYYVANEHPELAPKFALPVDRYRLAQDRNAIVALEHRLQDAMSRLGEIERELVAARA